MLAACQLRLSVYGTACWLRRHSSPHKPLRRGDQNNTRRPFASSSSSSCNFRRAGKISTVCSGSNRRHTDRIRSSNRTEMPCRVLGESVQPCSAVERKYYYIRRPNKSTRASPVVYNRPATRSGWKLFSSRHSTTRTATTMMEDDDPFQTTMTSMWWSDDVQMPLLLMLLGDVCVCRLVSVCRSTRIGRRPARHRTPSCLRGPPNRTRASDSQ